MNTIIAWKIANISYPSVLTQVLGNRKNRLIETVLLSTHNICFAREIRKISLITHSYLGAAAIFLSVSHSQGDIVVTGGAPILHFIVVRANKCSGYTKKDNKMSMWNSISSADPESFVRGGPTLTTFSSSFFLFLV